MKRIIATSKDIFNAYLKEKNITDETVESLKDAAFISINNTDAVGDTPPPFLQSHPNVITLYFDDVPNEVPIILTDKIALPLNQNQALNIIKFIRNNEDKEAFIIHCTAGASRSVAVAEYINLYFNTVNSDTWLSPTQKFIIDLLTRANQAYEILYPTIQNATKTIYPDDRN